MLIELDYGLFNCTLFCFISVFLYFSLTFLVNRLNKWREFLLKLVLLRPTRVNFIYLGGVEGTAAGKQETRTESSWVGVIYSTEIRDPREGWGGSGKGTVWRIGWRIPWM
jgi:hypothetical protein